MSLSPDEIEESDFADARHVHMEGYLAFNRDLMEKILVCAKNAGCTTSFDLASFEVVKASGDILDGWLSEYIDIVFANEDEASAYFPGLGDDYARMAREFAGRCHIAAVKLGEKGSLIANGDDMETVEAIPVERLVDTTGAGDYWAGGFLHAWLNGLNLRDCGRFGSLLGAEVVQVSGAALAEDRWQSLREELLAHVAASRKPVTSATNQEEK